MGKQRLVRPPLLLATTSAIYGPVSYDPWIGKATSTPAICCSSVLFVPGLEASRLSIDNRRVFGTSTSQLWEPISNLQVQSLYLNYSGNSIQSNIHPSGLLDNALGIQPIYQKFISTMNDLVTRGNNSRAGRHILMIGDCLWQKYRLA